jgi:hypothetical protein
LELFDNDGIIFAYRHGAPDIDTDVIKDPFSIRRVEVLRPTHFEGRVIVQQSVFTVEPDSKRIGAREDSQLLSWNVSSQHAEQIRLDLARIGISKSLLFPGLESTADEITKRFRTHFSDSNDMKKSHTASQRLPAFEGGSR